MAAFAPITQAGTGPTATTTVWTGRGLSGLAIAFFVFDGAMKLIQPQAVIDATRELGWPADSASLYVLGVVLLAATAIYAFPRTSVLGAILLTGYSAERSRAMPASAALSSRTICSASIADYSFGAVSGCGTPA